LLKHEDCQNGILHSALPELAYAACTFCQDLLHVRLDRFRVHEIHHLQKQFKPLVYLPPREGVSGMAEEGEEIPAFPAEDLSQTLHFLSQGRTWILIQFA